ncbi:MAG TPA: MCE family protein [Chitinophagales bacterium]|nr:MCE family protein [Chitinophagales bacterium]HNE47011.1 MCE family protein [Chitinophagales bacterium]HNI54989.1 MCE family protein [Chitinophagales bacterium]HNJ89751.1 MCE family protein [Chitinophagales bacterium]HNM30579.1 MCE family protein [Chitinophagales bacterium]
MKAPTLLLLTTSLLFSACANKKDIIYVKPTDVTGLSVNSKVTVDGYKVGEVDDMYLDNNGKVIVEIAFDEPVQIPTDSKFWISYVDLPDEKGITIDYGENKEMLSPGDTVLAINKMAIFQSDSLAKMIQGILENISGAKQRDSILQELDRLNQNIDEIKDLNAK